MKSSVLVLIITLLCNGPAISDDLKIDGSSEEVFYESSLAAAKDLNDSQKLAFIRAIDVISEKTITIEEFIAASSNTVAKEEIKHKKLAMFTGLTPYGVVKKAKEIAESLLSKGTLPDDENAVGNIQITDISSEKIKDPILDSKIEIKFNVRNKTNKALSRLVFLAIAKSDNRQIPWHTDDNLIVKIRGGIEPNESKKISTILASFDWPLKEIPDDAKITLTLYSVYGADSKLLWSIKPRRIPINKEEAVYLEESIHIFNKYLEQ